MTWQEAVATVCILIGLMAGAYMVGQRPAFWIEFGTRLLVKIWPLLSKFVLARMTPAEEQELAEAVRRGESDAYMRDHLRKKLKPIFGRQP